VSRYCVSGKLPSDDLARGEPQPIGFRAAISRKEGSETLIKVITITHQPGSRGTELARLVARTLGWEILDHQLVDRIARIADLDVQTAGQLDEQAVRWWRRLLTAGIGVAAPSPHVTPRWLGDVDEDSVHDLTVQVIQAAADSGGCVIVGRGAQCLLQDRGDALNVLVHAPIDERVRTLRARYPECADAQAFLKAIDSQRARYIRHYYGRDWLDPTLYHLCVNASLGLAAAAMLVNLAVTSTDEGCTPSAEREVSLCHSQHQL
jgi:cytidylate kinase